MDEGMNIPSDPVTIDENKVKNEGEFLHADARESLISSSGSELSVKKEEILNEDQTTSLKTTDNISNVVISISTPSPYDSQVDKNVVTTELKEMKDLPVMNEDSTIDNVTDKIDIDRTKHNEDISNVRISTSTTRPNKNQFSENIVKTKTLQLKHDMNEDSAMDSVTDKTDVATTKNNDDISNVSSSTSIISPSENHLSENIVKTEEMQDRVVRNDVEIVMDAVNDKTVSHHEANMRIPEQTISGVIDENTDDYAPEQSNNLSNACAIDSCIETIPQTEIKSLPDVPHDFAMVTDCVPNTENATDDHTGPKYSTHRTDTRKSDEDSIDSDSSSSSDSEDSSDLELSSDQETKTEVKNVVVTSAKVKGELEYKDLEPLEDLKITVDDNVVMQQVGEIMSIIDLLVIIKADRDVPALDADTILFLDGKQPLGMVFETFGPVISPLYSIRFNSKEHIAQFDVEAGKPVFYAPQMETFTKYVFVTQLRKMRGSDASWENNHEPPAKFLEFSDDEEERRMKKKGRGHNVDAEGEEGSTKKKKKPKWKSAENQSHSSTGDSRNNHQTSISRWPPNQTQRWRPPAPSNNPRFWSATNQQPPHLAARNNQQVPRLPAHNTQRTWSSHHGMARTQSPWNPPRPQSFMDPQNPYMMQTHRPINTPTPPDGSSVPSFPSWMVRQPPPPPANEQSYMMDMRYIQNQNAQGQFGGGPRFPEYR